MENTKCVVTSFLKIEMENTNSCEETNHENGIWSWNILFQVWNGKYKQWIVTEEVREGIWYSKEHCACHSIFEVVWKHAGGIEDLKKQ